MFILPTSGCFKTPLFKSFSSKLSINILNDFLDSNHFFLSSSKSTLLGIGSTSIFGALNFIPIKKIKYNIESFNVAIGFTLTKVSGYDVFFLIYFSVLVSDNHR